MAGLNAVRSSGSFLLTPSARYCRHRLLHSVRRTGMVLDRPQLLILATLCIALPARAQIVNNSRIVATYNPSQSATSVSGAANIILTFNGTIQAGTGAVTLTKLDESGNVLTGTGNVQSMAVASSQISGTAWTINPTNNLAGL